MRLITPGKDHTRYGAIDWVKPKKELAERIGFLEADKVFKRLQLATGYARKVEKEWGGIGHKVTAFGCYVTAQGVDCAGYDKDSPIGIWVYFPTHKGFGDSDLMKLPYLKSYYSPKVQHERPGLPYGLVWRGY
jgi:hypothetical protein